jgi:SAM-dependent methyltransferase
MDTSAMARRAVRFFNTRQGRFEIRRRTVAVDGTPERPPQGMRELVAQLYISGDGLEIGALNGPLRLPTGARVRYVDRLSMADLREHYPGLDLVEVDIIDDGERLTSVPKASQDFIIANHFLEHCEDPLRTLQTLASRIKLGGVLFMAVPDADLTFDRERQSTTFSHLIEDHDLGPAQSREQHYREWGQSC